MVLLYPLLVVVAGVLLWRRRTEPSGRGRVWFFAWTAAGFLLSLSFITGLSIGLLILPFAGATSPP